MIGLNVGSVLTTVVLAVTVVVMGIMIVRRCRRPKTGILYNEVLCNMKIILHMSIYIHNSSFH